LISHYLDDVWLETTVFSYSRSLPKPDKIVSQIKSGLTEVYCNCFDRKKGLGQGYQTTACGPYVAH